MVEIWRYLSGYSWMLRVYNFWFVVILKIIYWALFWGNRPTVWLSCLKKKLSVCNTNLIQILHTFAHSVLKYNSYIIFKDTMGKTYYFWQKFFCSKSLKKIKNTAFRTFWSENQQKSSKTLSKFNKKSNVTHPCIANNLGS